MPTAFAFRLSIYITLACSSVSLGYSEWDYLPEVSLFTAATVLAMAVAFVMDSRGRHLSIRQANVVGVLIFAMAAAWIGYHYGRADSLMHTLPWPAGGLPYLGPLLMVLVAAKLFRPKTNGDWWALYGISIASIGLAIALADDGLFVVFVLLYVASGVWSLSLFHLRREAASITNIAPERHRVQFWPAMRWTAFASLVATPIFFLTPRTSGVHWELFQSRLESGMPLDGSPDLSRTGQLKPSHEVAFEVLARTADGQPKIDLPYDQRWRGFAFADYHSPRGRWSRRDRAEASRIIAPVDIGLSRPSEKLIRPELGPNAYELEFRLISRTGGPIFADPVAFTIGGPPPIATPLRSGYGYAWQTWDASFVMIQRELRFSNRYFQWTCGRDDRGRDPVFSFRLTDPENPELLTPFLFPPPPAVAEYARRLLGRLLADGSLPRAVMGRMNTFGSLHPDDYAIVAEAFRMHLSFSGGFTYSLDLRRQDRNIDPMEDFLINTRSGHCERFASALVLMLRGVDVPSQLILGYRGQESAGNGSYIVRQENAHAWAEVLLPRTVQGDREWYWQAFDPTPFSVAGDSDESEGFIESGASHGQRLFAEFVLNLNPDSQRRLNASLGDFLDENWLSIAVGFLVLSGLSLFLRSFLIRLRKARTLKAAAVVAPWYRELLDLLNASGLSPAPGETPREFAARAHDWLQSKPATSAHADVPVEATRLYYLLRYAEQTPDQIEIDSLTAAMKRINQNG